MIYTQSEVRSPHTDCCVGMRDDVFSLPKLGQLFCLRTRLWIALALGPQPQGNFTSEAMKRRTLSVNQSNHVGVELLSYLNTFVEFMLHIEIEMHRNLDERSGTTHFLLWFIQQKAALVFVEKRIHNTQPNYSFPSVRKVVHISWRHVCRAFNWQWHWLRTWNI